MTLPVNGPVTMDVYVASASYKIVSSVAYTLLIYCCSFHKVMLSFEPNEIQCRINYGSGGSLEPGPLNSGTS